MDNNKLFVPEEILNKVVKCIETKSTLTLVGLPSSGKSRLVKRAVIDLKVENFYVALDCSLYVSSINSDFAVLRDKLDSLYSQGKRVFLIEGFNSNINEINPILDLIEKFRLSTPEKIAVIFFVTFDILQFKGQMLGSILNIVEYINIKDKEFIKENLKNNSERYRISLKEIDLDVLTRTTGDIPILVKKYFILKSLTADTLDKNNYTSELNRFYSDLDILTLNLIKKILKNNPLSSDEQVFTEKIGLYGEIGVVLKFTALSYSPNSKIKIFNNRVFINDVDKTELFSIRQLEFLDILKKNNEITRDEIHKVLTNEDGFELYSEARIDKFVSRLRDKLSQLGVRRDVIKTDKKNGYSIIS